jgi:hypothetical protein
MGERNSILVLLALALLSLASVEFSTVDEHKIVLMPPTVLTSRSFNPDEPVHTSHVSYDSSSVSTSVSGMASTTTATTLPPGLLNTVKV